MSKNGSGGLGLTAFDIVGCARAAFAKEALGAVVAPSVTRGARRTTAGRTPTVNGSHHIPGARQRLLDGGGGWNVAESLDQNGESHRRYYFREKEAVRCELNSRTARQYAGYTLIEKDIRTVKRWIAMLRAELAPYRSATSEPGYWMTPDDDAFYVPRALYVSIVTIYGKMFTKAEGRRVKLERRNISGEQMLATHDSLMHHRNNFTAHSGAGGPERCRVVLAIDSSKKSRTPPRLYTELHQPATLAPSELDAVDLLLDALRDWVIGKQDALGDLTLKDAPDDLDREQLKRQRKHLRGRFIWNRPGTGSGR